MKRRRTIMTRKSISVVLDGQTFASQEDAIEYLGKHRSTIYKKMQETGKTFEEVCEDYIKTKPKNTYVINGKFFHLKKDVLKYFSLDKSTINKKIKKTGLSFKEVCEYYINKRNQPAKYVLGDNKFNSVDDLCDFLHVQRSGFYQYMRKHAMTFDQVCEYYYKKNVLKNDK
jgi:predicted DNA-binding transcriptional regulator AlpA